MDRKIVYIFISLLCPVAMQAADMKFFRKAAEKVWNTRPDLFDPHREIPDSVREKFSAVIIGEYDYLEADYQSFRDLHGTNTRSERICFVRKMVKLLDSKAVEEFSKHEFGESGRIGVRYRRNLAEIDHVFGARVHKPDGTVNDVDVSRSFAISEGKNANDKNALKRIIDIPGLEPGDVLEYFSFTQDKMQELDLPSMRLTFMSEYPVLDIVMEGVFDPELTVEYRGYNGAPELETGVNEKGDNTVWIRRMGIPVLTDTHFVNRVRSLPFYDFCILNNTSPHRFYPKSSRKGGLYPDPFPGTIFRDISLVMAASDYDSSLPGKVRRILKDYRKVHPDAGRKELAEAAWAASNYVNLTDDRNDESDYWLALMFCDVLRKENLGDTLGVAFINPSTDVPTTEIVNWRQPDFGALVDGRLFISPDLAVCVPGELAAAYQGQRGASYPGERERLWDFTMPELFTTPLSKAQDNKLILKAVVILGDDHDASVSNELTLTGAMKGLGSSFTNAGEWIAEQEEYLSIPPDKRRKADATLPVDRKSEIDEAASQVYGLLFNGENHTVSDVAVLKRGIVPSAPDFRMEFKSRVPEIATDAGDDLIVRVGAFAGKVDRIEGAQRDRMTNIDFGSARQENYTITLMLPEGYEVDDQSVETLTNNVQNTAGMFVSGAKKSEDGRSVVIAVRTRIQHPVIKASGWPAVLELNDARVGFADAQLVLKPVK